MRAFNWLKKLRRSERGNIIVLGAATMPLVMGGAAMALDTVQIELWKRQMQRSADSSAIAGAYALAQGAAADEAVSNDLDEHAKPDLTSTIVTPGSFAAGTIASTSCAARGINPCFGRAIQVELVTEKTMPFLSMFTDRPVTVRATATAAVFTQGEYCMISLYDGTDAGIDVNGNADVTLGCGMATNSRAASAVTAGGTSTITATPVAAVGGIDGAGNNFEGETTLQPYSAPQSDPFAYLPNPDTSTMDCTLPFDEANPKTGCFSSMNIKGTVTLPAGEYFITGDVTFNAKANITGDGVTLIMTGASGTGAAGDLKINGQAKLDLAAPSSGTYKGVLFYRDRRAANLDIRITGGAGSVFEGALYFPSSDIFLAGNSDIDVRCLQMVGRKIGFRGTASITNECPATGGSSSFARHVVRLVG